MPDRTRAAMRQLIGDGMFRTIGIPTKRFGEPGFVSVTGAVVGNGPERRVPYHWILVDASSSRIIVFAETEAISPLLGWAPTTAPPPPAPSARTEEHDDSWRLAIDAFFGGAPLAAEHRDRACERVLGSIPAPLLEWVLDCCDDFWTWLRSPGGETV